MSLKDCRIIELSTHADKRGNLTVIEGGARCPFEIKRVFYIYDAIGKRGGHAHKSLHQFFVCVAGHVEIFLGDGIDWRIETLKDPGKGLYVPPMTWNEFYLSPQSICLVLCSDHYDEADYLRDYEEFLALL